VVALPSTLEGLSIALLEAMARRCACVVSDIPPNREAAGDTALFVPPEDPAALSAALADLLAADPERRREMGERAAARALERYSWERVADATAAVYRQVLGRENAG